VEAHEKGVPILGHPV